MKVHPSVPVALLTLALAACSANVPVKTGVGSNASTPEEAVAARAQARWDAIVAKDFEAAYAYLTPGARSTTSLDAYSRRMLNATIRWTKAEVREVTCEDADLCNAMLMITYKVRGASPGVGELEGFAPVHEKWLRSKDGWFHLPEATGH